MEKEKIERINELARKKKTVGLTVEELEGLSKALARREAELYPVPTQLPRDPERRETPDGGFLI